MSDRHESGSNVRPLGRAARPSDKSPSFVGPSDPSSRSETQTRPSPPSVVSFHRLELGEILRLYGRKVAAGEWRDYALDFTAQKAVFSIYRRTSEAPLYRVEKDPANARKQGAYSVIAASGLIMRRGNDLSRVIAVLDKAVRLVPK